MFVLECERVKKQEYRRNKRNIVEVNEHIVLEETHKKHKKTFHDHEKSFDQSHKRMYKTISFKYSCRTIVLYLHAAIKHGLEKVFACWRT